jgi:hypothetical protein
MNPLSRQPQKGTFVRVGGGGGVQKGTFLRVGAAGPQDRSSRTWADSGRVDR